MLKIDNITPLRNDSTIWNERQAFETFNRFMSKKDAATLGDLAEFMEAFSAVTTDRFGSDCRAVVLRGAKER